VLLVSDEVAVALIQIPARTLRSEAVLTGIGLHTGQTVTVRLQPAEAGSGLRFVRCDLTDKPAVSVQDVDPHSAPFRMALKKDKAEVHTVEHLLAALSGSGVTDCLIEIDGQEVPGMDGSALPFAEALQKVGLVSSGKQTVALAVDQPVSIGDGAASMTVLPRAESLTINYTLHYPGNALAQGNFEIALTPESFLSEIAPARTFVMKADVDAMRAAGLGKGATLQNTVVVDGDKVVETTLRFPNEPVRHKILDLIGDLYTLGMPLRGEIVAKCTGHRQNRQLVARLRG
jgi:UDP-3-O-acyl N-acetylglucosamine deacetylase